MPIVWETGVQSQVDSYQRLKKRYLMLHCLTLGIKRYGSRVKWSNPGKGVTPSPTPQCCSYWKGSLWVTLDDSHQLTSLSEFEFSGHIVAREPSLLNHITGAKKNIWIHAFSKNIRKTLVRIEVFSLSLFSIKRSVQSRTYAG